MLEKHNSHKKLLKKVLQRQRKQFWKPIRNFFAPSPITIKNFLQNFAFFEIFLCTHAFYFWQRYQKNSPICRKNPAEGPKKIKVFVLFQKFLHFQEKFRRICGLHFWKPWPKKLARSPFSCWKFENDEDIVFFAN